MPATEYTKEPDSAVEAVKASEEWRREYMILFLRDRENVRLGEYKKTVFQIRKNYKMDRTPDAIAGFLFIPAEKCSEVISVFMEHPDWDDEQVAEESDWA